MGKQLKKMIAFIRGFINAKLGSKLSREKIEKIQQTRFNKLQREALSTSEFYSCYVNKPLDEYPVIRKAIHVENFNIINTAGLDKDTAFEIAIASEKSRDFTPDYKGFSVGLSSGTSGNRGLFVTSVEERAQWAGYIIGKLLPFRCGKHRVAFFLRANNNLYESSNGILLIFKFFDLIDGLNKNIKKLVKFNPTILIAPASVLLKIIEKKPKINPVKVIAIAEVLEASDKRLLESYFQQKIHQIYQCTEGFVAATCSEGNLHLNEDVLIIEKKWINQESGRFSPILTDLKRVTQPVIRYYLDDILIEDKAPCACGSNFTRLKAIEGRKDDIFYLRNNRNELIDVFPDFIRNSLIIVSAELIEYQVIQSEKNKLVIYILPFNEVIRKNISSALDELFNRLDVLIPQYEFDEFKVIDNGKKRRRVMRQIDG
ncbi:MAG: adenylate synthase [Gammaproteobacteria bacterium]|nr:adenylate synthase [Gammaproteobacteria bacterium]